MTNHEQVEQSVSRRSILIYLPILLGTALLFLVLASTTGDYLRAARCGGTVRFGLLIQIISMPVITTWFKEHNRSRSNHIPALLFF